MDNGVIILLLLVLVLNQRTTKRKRIATRQKQPIQKHSSTKYTTLRPPFKNEPLSGIDIERWMKYLRINKFNGVFSKDKIQNCTQKGFYIINLDDETGLGTHWTALNIKPHTIEYFESFGLNCPQEVVVLSDKLGVNYIYKSSQYQEISPVLCGYYCIYLTNELSKSKTYYKKIKAIDIRDTRFNEQFIINYFI